jgi:hypothetical protein
MKRVTFAVVAFMACQMAASIVSAAPELLMP